MNTTALRDLPVCRHARQPRSATLEAKNMTLEATRAAGERPVDRIVRAHLQMSFESSFRKLGVAENFGKQAAPDVLTRMNGNNRGTPIRVLQIVMTAANANNLKAQPLQD